VVDDLEELFLFLLVQGEGLCEAFYSVLDVLFLLDHEGLIPSTAQIHIKVDGWLLGELLDFVGVGAIEAPVLLLFPDLLHVLHALAHLLPAQVSLLLLGIIQLTPQTLWRLVLLSLRHLMTVPRLLVLAA